MNVLVVNTNRHKTPMAVLPFGACIAAEAAERAGHSVRLLDMTFSKDPLRALEHELTRSTPDVVGLSVRNIDSGEMHDPVIFVHDVAPMADLIRKRTPAAPIVLGGAGVGLMPEELLRATGAEWAVLSDAEAVFPKLLAAFTNGGDPTSVPRVAWLKDEAFGQNAGNGHFPLDECVVPDFGRWLRLKSYRHQMCTVPVQTKRGCPHKCVYCTYQRADGPGHRLAPPASVVEAVRRLAKAGLRDIEFVDSVFNSPYEHAMEICERLAAARLGVRLITLELNPRFVDDALLAAMERAGFVAIAVTAESASDPVLAGLGKGYTAEEVVRAAEAVRRHRLPCMWVFLFGGPGETEQTVAETLRFADEHIRRSDAAYINTGIRIYPGTELERIARAQGVLSVPPDAMLSPVFYVSPEVDPRWVAERVREAVASHANYLGPASISVPFLPMLYRIGYALGIRPPLWRYTRLIRRLLRLVGKDPC